MERLRDLKRAGRSSRPRRLRHGLLVAALPAPFPLDALKIAELFVDGIERSVEDAALARATFSSATPSASIVAEGVETAEQLEALRLLGCRFAQGYFLGRPQAPELLEAIFAAEPVLRRSA